MPQVINQEDSNYKEDDPPPGQLIWSHEAPIKLPYMDPTSKPKSTSKKYSKELTSEHKFDDSSEPSVPTREDYIEHLASVYIVCFKKGHTNLDFPSWKKTPVTPLGRHLKDSDFGLIRYPGRRRRPTNSDQDPIPTPHQLGGSVKGLIRIQDHKGGHVQAVVYQGPFGTVREVVPGLVSYYEPFHLKLPPKIIQESNNTQEDHQDKRTIPLNRLYIW